MINSRQSTTDGVFEYQRDRIRRDTPADPSALVIGVYRPEQFRGNVSYLVTPAGVEFVRLAAGPQVLGGQCENRRHAVWLGLLLEGAAVIGNGSECWALMPGDIVYSRTGVYADLRLETDFQLLITQFPMSMLSAHLLAPLAPRVGCLSGSAGIGRVFSGMLRSVAETIDSLEAEQLRNVEAALVELLVATVAVNPSSHALDGAARERTSLLHRIWQSIECALGDPNLSAKQIAEANGMSDAELKTLLASAGRNFDSYVRLRRLERSRADFEDPLHANLSISDIWVRRGFRSADSFSRAFRNRYGSSPRKYRKSQQTRALECAGSRGPRWSGSSPGSSLFRAMAEH
jgi:AraC-like DNA-binding protein